MKDTYNTEEEFMYAKQYNFIKGFAIGRKLFYTLKALPLARVIHNGQYRKGTVNVNGEERQLPYITHVLKVCDTLISIFAFDDTFTNEEFDILCAAALLHDAIEDAPDGFFCNGGRELVTNYGFPEQVYHIIKLLSKRSGATKEELDAYFNAIREDRFALLIKLSDRGHNVETLYSMKFEKLHKYVEETRQWIYPMVSYAKITYPELSNGLTILKSKIVSLTEETEALVSMFENSTTGS